MAFFKLRKDGDEHPAAAPAPESVEAMRTRERHRLIGASVLVLLGVVGFPMLFDSQPRPISVDIPIEIPDKNTVKPLATLPPPKPASDVVIESDAGSPVSVASAPGTETGIARPPAPDAAVAPAKPTSRAVASSVAATPAQSVTAADKLASKPVPKPEVKAEVKTDIKTEGRVIEKAIATTGARNDDGAKAQALLEGRDADQPASPGAAGGRFVVQIGAFSDAAKAQESRMKLERAGLKTYTQVVQPKEGKRIRVRVGPFESKAEADKVAEKVKKLDLTAVILEL